MKNDKWWCGLALVIGAAAIAFWWRETRARGAAELEHAQLQRELAEARVALRSLAERDRAGAPPPRTNGAPSTVEATPAAAPPASSLPQARDNTASDKARKAAIAEALLRQRVRRLMSLEMNVRPKFHSLGLSDEQWNRYQILSLEKADREEEAKRARKTGQTAEELEAAIRAAGGEISTAIRTLVGGAAYDELAQFQSERSDPNRKTVEALNDRLMFSNAPLEGWQIEKLRAVLRLHSSAPSSNGGTDGIADDLSAGIRSVLTPPQLEYWRRLQIEQARLTDAAAISKRFESAKNTPTR